MADRMGAKLVGIVLNKFPLGIIYLQRPTEIVVIAVSHLSAGDRGLLAYRCVEGL